MLFKSFKKTFFILLLGFFVFAPFLSLAAEGQLLSQEIKLEESEEKDRQVEEIESEVSENKEVEQKILKAVVGEDKSVAVSRKVVFDASKSVNPDENQEMQYRWDLGDGHFKEGVDVIHTYDKPGFYRVALTVNNGRGQDTAELIVSVYEDLILLLADDGADRDKIASLKRYAARQGILLVTIEDRSGGADFIVEDNLVKSLFESSQDLKKANIVIVWTSSPSLGLNVLSEFGKEAENLNDLDFSHKGAVIITEKNLEPIGRIAQSTFDVLGPEYILLTKTAGLEAVIDARQSDRVVEEVQQSGVENLQIGIHSERAVKKLGVTNFLSYTVNYLVNSGVAPETISLILLLPIVATLIAVARQFLGVKTFGIYIPSLLSLTLVVTGIKYGLFIFLVLLMAATLIRLLLKKIKILYLPRMALVLTSLAFVLLALFVAGSLTKRTGIIALSFFPILVLIILVEKFVEVQIEKGFASALKLTIETLLVSVACYYIISWESLKTFILAYPEVILLTLVVNILAGKWVGLRASEYLRFRSLSSFLDRKKES
ncbi:PKD domain-containing protein [Patescibacteria group bacterium]|nr:PKD domain-containing protein [Patescibacteria group bacterium]